MHCSHTHIHTHTHTQTYTHARAPAYVSLPFEEKHNLRHAERPESAGGNHPRASTQCLHVAHNRHGDVEMPWDEGLRTGVDIDATEHTPRVAEGNLLLQLCRVPRDIHVGVVLVVYEPGKCLCVCARRNKECFLRHDL